LQARRNGSKTSSRFDGSIPGPTSRTLKDISVDRQLLLSLVVNFDGNPLFFQCRAKPIDDLLDHSSWHSVDRPQTKRMALMASESQHVADQAAKSLAFG